MAENRAFVIMQVGQKGSPDRKRADDVYSYVVAPALDEVGPKPYRSDLDPTPGQVNAQMLRRLLEATVVIADLTGRNPNVFYEFGIVHAFARPVVALADRASALPFDAHDERVIELGEYQGELGVRRAEEAKAALRQALDVVLAPGYIPASPLSEVAAHRSLDKLAPENPIAAELTAIRKSLSALRGEIAQERAHRQRAALNEEARRLGVIYREIPQSRPTEPSDRLLRVVEALARSDDFTSSAEYLDFVRRASEAELGGAEDAQASAATADADTNGTEDTD